MATYIPDPADATQPVDGVSAGTAAAEFRALKGRVNTVVSDTGGKAASGANSDITSLTGLTGVVKLASSTVAALPAAPGAGAVMYATNGRKVGELGGAGTGVIVYFSDAAWRVLSTDAVVAV